jgi:hypothetical protein
VAWVLVAWAISLRAAINTIAPTRDKSLDGSIGDPAHASGVSGHNPDDTAGVTAERSDADSIPEVRAIDVDKDLRQPGLTMLKIIQAILASPVERARLIYIIFNGVIWSASNGWASREYNGPNSHSEHAHYSGNPAADTNGAPWPSVLALGGDMGVPEDVWAVRSSSPALGVTDRSMSDWIKFGDRAERAAKAGAEDSAARDAVIVGKLNQLLDRPPVTSAPIDQAQIDAAVAAALSNPQVIAAIAVAVADEQHRRMES